jgi:predicted P-loop ATPase
MLVLEGEQDTGKSSAVKILAGDFFRDEEIISKSNKEAQELTCGVWLYEMSELVGLSKRDVEHVKNFLSRTHDSARGVWGRKLEDQPRTYRQPKILACADWHRLTSMGLRGIEINCGPKQVWLRQRARH